MDLHRASKVADWEKVEPSQWNKWQQRAAETRGIDTPGNRETAKGAFFSLFGLAAIAKDKPFIGTALLGWGRWKDITDGKVADKTGTKSPVGEAFDATTDKILMGVAIPVLHKKGVITDTEKNVLFAESVVSSAATLLAKFVTKREIHPSRIGKNFAFASWAGMGSLCLSHALESHDLLPQTSEFLHKFGHVALQAGLVGAGIASVGYAKDAVIGESLEQPSASQLGSY